MRNCQTVFQYFFQYFSGWNILWSHQQCMRVSFSSDSCDNLFSDCFYNCHFSGWEVVLHCAFDLHFRFRKYRGTRDQIANTRWIIEKTREFQKTSISALLTMPKPLTVWITINCGKFWKRWEYQNTWPVSLETCMQVRKQQ